jgi:hypothetical protein
MLLNKNIDSKFHFEWYVMTMNMCCVVKLKTHVWKASFENLNESTNLNC